MSSQHVVSMKGNLSLNQWNAARAAKELPIQGHEPFFPGVYQKQLGFGTGVEKCVRTVTVLMAGKSLPHTIFFLIFPLLHCHNLRCTSPLHPAIPVYTVWVRKQQRCSGGVRGGWVTFTLFILTAAHLTSSRNAFTSLDGTVSVFYCEDETGVNSKIMKGRRNVQLTAAATIKLQIIFNYRYIIVSFRLTKQMLVSGMMSESETTSSFPDRLPELSTAPSSPKLAQRKGN